MLYLSSIGDLAMYASTQAMVDFSLEKKFPLSMEDFELNPPFSVSKVCCCFGLFPLEKMRNNS